MTVEHIKYKNKRLPVKMGYRALKMMQKEHGVSMEQIQGDIALYEPLLFYSLETGHKVEKKEFTFTMEDMEDMLEEVFFDFVALIPKFFPDAEKLMGEAGMKNT